MEMPNLIGEWSVVVAIATRGHPDGCRRVVPRVLRQQLPEGIRLRVLVVDNNPISQDFELPASVDITHEPDAGIPQARNRAVAQSVETGDVLVFIDDDEEPADTDWLHRLLEALQRYEADMATGPIRSVHEPGAPTWAAAHPVFHRPRFETGTLRPQGYSNNLAIRTSLLRRMDRWFDPALRVTGGSDTEFTRRASRMGARIVWVDEAEVLEHVPAHRATLRWILRRSLRLGANRVQRLRLEGRSPVLYAAHLAGATLELAAGTVLAGLTPVLGRRRGAIGLGRAARGIGVWYALAARRGVEEYRTAT